MPAPVWPPTLPQEFDGPDFQDALPEQRVQSELTEGKPQSRTLARRSEYAPLSGRMSVTTAQWNTLLAFYQTTLGDGALAFDFPDVDSPTDTIPAAFKEEPALSTIGGDLHIVRISLERQS